MWIERPLSGLEHEDTRANHVTWGLVSSPPPRASPRQLKGTFRCTRDQSWDSTWYDLIEDVPVEPLIPGSASQGWSSDTAVFRPPRNVIIQGINNGQVLLQWQPPESAELVDGYIVTVNNYFTCDTPQGELHLYSNEALAAAIPIMDNTSYVFSVQAVVSEVESQARKVALVLRKHRILTMHLQNILPAEISIVDVPLRDKTATGGDILIKEPKVTVSQFLPSEETSTDTNTVSAPGLGTADGGHTAKILRRRIGQPVSSDKECVVLLLGYNDSGKLPFIDDLMNYNLGVIYRDNFRFKLADANSSKPGTCEEMLRTTIYTLPYQHGLEMRRIKLCALPDLDITTKNPKAFESHMRKCCDPRYGVDHVNAIAFVTTSNGPPLNQKVLGMLSSLFGPEVKHNMLTIITDSDKRRPRVLKNEAMADYDCFCFNNSVTFGAQRDELKPIWSASIMNFQQLFRKLHDMRCMTVVPTIGILSALNIKAWLNKIHPKN